MEKILITGASFSGNRGAAAMAISFIDQARKYLENDFIFSVAPVYFDLEKKWAEHYGVDIVSEKSREYKEVLKNCKCMVNLNGIAFVGDGSRKWYSSVYEHHYFKDAKKYKKPFFRFIQSYGPFDDWRVRLIAQKEFKNIPCVMARGALSANHCRNITDAPVYKFPDIAITLKTGIGLSGEYIVLCPSVTTAKINKEKYISLFRNLITYYRNKNENVVLLPHTLSPDKNKCDKELCKEIGNARIIMDEFDCVELKGIIAGAKFAVVSRYHALVAALSSGVPVVSIGWNDKYQDIMDFYDSSQYAFDFRKDVNFMEIVEKISNWKGNEKQKELELETDKACKLFANWVLNL